MLPVLSLVLTLLSPPEVPATVSVPSDTPKARRATMACPAGELCLLLFPPGEVVQEIACSSPAEWTLKPMTSGGAVVVAPQEGATGASAIILTGAGLYRVDLLNRSPATPEVSFPPDAETLSLTSYRGKGGPARTDDKLTLAGDRINLAYRIDRHAKAPRSVLDDGTRTLLIWDEKPPEAFVVLAMDGKTPTLVHSRLAGSTTLLIDGTWPHLQLRQGETIINIKRRGRR